MADGKITFDTSIDQSGLKNDLKGVKSSLSGLKNMFAGIGKAAIAAFSVGAIINFGKECVTLGSNVAEVQNVVDTAFGEMAYKIEDFAKTSIQNYGMSQLSAKKTASTYMAMAKGMNMEDEAASNMAISLTGLTGDVASFYNISQELADTKLKSIFTGETETLKDLGVVMTQTNLNAYAMANGFGKTVDKMTQAEAVQLRYAYVTNQLRLASGDFLKTQDSWANQTRILSEQMKELMSVIGQGLIQVLTPFVKVLNQIVAYLLDMATAASAAMTALFGGEQKTYKQTATDIATATENQEDLTAATEKTAKAAKNATLGFDELNTISQDSGESSNAGSLATDITTGGTDTGNIVSEEAVEKAEGLIKKIETVFGKISAKFRSTFSPAIDACGKAFTGLENPVKNALGSVGRGLTSLWDGSIKPFGSYFCDTFVPNIVNSAGTNLAPIFSDVCGMAIEEMGKDFEWTAEQMGKVTNDIIIPAFQDMEMVATDCMGSVGSTWDEYGDSLTSKFQGVRDSLKELWENIYNDIIKPITDRLGEIFDWLWKDHLKPFIDNCIEFIAALCEAIMAIWNNYLMPLVNYYVDVLSPIVTNVINIIVDVVGTLFAFIVDVVSGLIRSLKGILNFITGVFTGDWEKAWTGIKDFFGGIWDIIWGCVKGVINLIIDALNAVWAAVYSVFAGIANGIGNAVSWVGSLLGKDWGFSLPSTPPYIPKLAQGAVIPPNREFLAVLGDQKQGTNIETPLDTMIQAFKTALAEGGYSGSGDTVVNLTAMLDGEVIYRNQERVRQKRGTQTVLSGNFAR